MGRHSTNIKNCNTQVEECNKVVAEKDAYIDSLEKDIKALADSSSGVLSLPSCSPTKNIEESEQLQQGELLKEENWYSKALPYIIAAGVITIPLGVVAINAINDHLYHHRLNQMHKDAMKTKTNPLWKHDSQNIPGTEYHDSFLDHKGNILGEGGTGWE